MVRRAGAGLILAGLAACSSGGLPTALKRSPEPAKAPPLTATPAGTVVALAADDPEGAVVTPTSGLLVVAARRPGAVYVLDPAHLQAAPRVIATDGAARHLELRGDDVVVPGEDTDTVSVLDVTTGRVVEQAAVGDHPHDAVAAGQDLVVTEEGARALSFVRDGAVVGRVTGPDTPGGIAASAGRVGAVAVRGRLLYVVDVATRTLLARVPVGAGPTHVVEVGPGVLAVADTTGDAILLVDIGDRHPHVIDHVTLHGRPYGMADDAVRGRLWVATGADNRLHRLDVTGTGEATRLVAGPTVPTVRQPDSLAVVPSTGAVVVVGATNPGALQLVP